jgi:ArsR family transcriptional regulator
MFVDMMRDASTFVNGLSRLPRMAIRTRPEGCCPVRAVRPLRAREQERLLAAFKALADPTRLEILRLVAAQAGPVCVCDIVDRFELAQPTISHHLKVLREGGWLRASKIGIWAFYELDPEGSARLAEAGALLGEGSARGARRRA